MAVPLEAYASWTPPGADGEISSAAGARPLSDYLNGSIRYAKRDAAPHLTNTHRLLTCPIEASEFATLARRSARCRPTPNGPGGVREYATRQVLDRRRPRRNPT